MKTKRWLLDLIFIAIGLGLLVLANWVALPTREFVRSANRVPGKVVKNELDWGTSAKHRDAGYHTIFTFNDPATHKVYQIRDDTRHNPSLYNSGDKISVLYPPGDPEEARIDCFRSLWVAPVTVAGGGVVILIFGFVGMAFDYVRQPAH